MAAGIDPDVKKLLDLRLAGGEISREEYSLLLDTLIEARLPQASAPDPSHSRGAPIASNPSEKALTIDDDLAIQSSGVIYSGNRFSFDRVTGLMYLAEVNSVRVGLTSVPSFYRTVLGIVFDGTIEVTKKAESRFVRRKRHSLLDEARVWLSERTFAPRLTRIVNELRAKGSIDLPTDPPVRLFASGDIVQGDLRANLRASAKQRRVEFGGSKYLYSVYDPGIIRIRMDESRLFVKKIQFTVRMNRDVIVALITHLMEHDGL